MNISDEIAKRASDIETRIRRFLPEQYEYQKTIVDAMSYSVLAGGKRLRPMLMEAAYQMFDGIGQDIDSFMAAIEMIHTYSLVHDDLPAMDNDMYRRGKKTTHAVYGEAMGILAGDALLNYAFETVADALVRCNGDMRMIRAYAVLSRKAGIYGMIGGQVVDVESEKKGQKVDQNCLDFIYRLKTGALIEASLMIGAILAGASDEEVTFMEQAGTKLGLAFQIQDDILDVTSSLEVLGKPIGSDERNEKATYVAFEGLEKAKTEVERLSKEAVQILDGLKKDHTFLKELFLYLIHREC
ncbi:MAG: polyprenyl synthetase family protein [Lachnobacterium sp.]|nr:polyprenyl synthetase family protein [Lachnobacterium sp.]MCI7086641.1 polyprenyl synthetase family protein [Lachnobacterium sp.]MDD7712604.1 polyprenyl synthetase family protein [Lachnobacterium sp.]MDY5461621.1 farnesyl diphosphate synthase [Agathobacter sp.]